MKAKAFYVLLFGLSFAFIESAVVVYLRALYYPEGFVFPMRLIPPAMISVEVAREAATMLLLVSVAWLAGSGFVTRTAWFLISFGVWDLFYYLWLKLLLDWPVSLLTWDLLFLIPIPWVAPILSPLLVSVTWILYGSVLLYRDAVGETVSIMMRSWAMMGVGAMMIFLTYIRDYLQMIFGCNDCTWSGVMENEEFLAAFAAYVPHHYAWGVFTLGWLVMAAGMAWSLRQPRGAATS